MTGRFRAALVAVVLAGIAPGVAAGAEQPSTTPSEGEPTGTGRAVVADGHVDLGPRFINDRWTLQLRDDTVRPVVWRNLPDVVLHAVDTATVTVPPDPTFAFLGTGGAKVWVLPQTQQPGILWPGWNTQDPTVVTKMNREATWRLHGMNGPGQFALFLTGNFGAPQILFDSTKPYPQDTGIESGSHVHGNWAFSAPGSYLLDVEMLATTMDGAPVTDRQTLRVYVGPGDPSAAFRTATSTAPTTTVATTTVTSMPSAAPAVRGSENTPAEPRTTPWFAIGGGALAVVVVGAVLVLWLRRARNRHKEML